MDEIVLDVSKLFFQCVYCLLMFTFTIDSTSCLPSFCFEGKGDRI